MLSRFFGHETCSRGRDVSSPGIRVDVTALVNYSDTDFVCRAFDAQRDFFLGASFHFTI
jgi:hypothetical protein